VSYIYIYENIQQSGSNQYVILFLFSVNYKQ